MSNSLSPFHFDWVLPSDHLWLFTCKVYAMNIESSRKYLLKNWSHTTGMSTSVLHSNEKSLGNIVTHCQSRIVPSVSLGRVWLILHEVVIAWTESKCLACVDSTHKFSSFAVFNKKVSRCYKSWNYNTYC